MACAWRRGAWVLEPSIEAMPTASAPRPGRAPPSPPPDVDPACRTGPCRGHRNAGPPLEYDETERERGFGYDVHARVALTGPGAGADGRREGDPDMGGRVLAVDLSGKRSLSCCATLESGCWVVSG